MHAPLPDSAMPPDSVPAGNRIGNSSLTGNRLPLGSLSLLLLASIFCVALLLWQISDLVAMIPPEDAHLHDHTSIIGVLIMGFLLAWGISLHLLQRWRHQLLDEIGQRQTAEKGLRDQSRLLDNIIANLPLSLFAKDARDNYRWIMWNRKSEELFDLKRSDVLGKTDYDLFPRHEADFFRNTDIAVMRDGRIVDIEEESVTTSRGTWPAHTIKVPIRDENGEPSILLGILEDITVRKQQANQQLQAYATELELKNLELEEARRRAEAADKAKTDFLATMSHEIRTPLNGVIGTADLLGRTSLNPQQDDYVRTIRKSGESLLYVINDILDVTRLEAQQLKLEHIPFDLARTLEDVINIHSTAASKKHLDLLLRYAPGTPTRLMGDPGRVRQILNNLLGNAVKFTHHGYIMVDVESAAPLPTDPAAPLTLSLSVRDTGIGIAPEHQGKVFERFTQAEASTNRKFGGSGLGLTICKQLVELMGGHIELESTPGRGSTFRFTLPATPDTTPPPVFDARPLHGKRVLVVDDNPINISILEEQLRHWGCVPQSFESSAQALLWLEQQHGSAPFDAMIIDHGMPDISGAELGERLRRNPLTTHTPMMVFSSRGDRGDTAFFAAKGFDGYLLKPARPEEIHLMLGTLIHGPKPAGILTRHALSDGAPAEQAEPETSGRRILVVEDDPVNQKVIDMMLREMGYDVLLATDGRQGLDAFNDTRFDLVLMDMQMPELDGPATTRLMRNLEEEEKRAHTPIIALTANALEEHQKLCLDAGMDGYMTKPITRAKLKEQLQTFLKA